MTEKTRMLAPRLEWSQPGFAAIALALTETTGLVFPANRRESAESGIRRAMTAACISDPADLLRAIKAAGEIRDILITELTIGETYFLREIGQLNFLSNTVLPELRASSPDRPLRLWSAGCATGEEAYSLAMTLKEAAWPGPFSVLGTDLAFARLVAAKRARYTAWSMRGVSESIVARYFERHRKQFLLRADIRNAVEFRVLNLAAADYPSALYGVGQMDVIFCRNVLIYFDLETVAAIAARLIASLAPGGWLFLGASDPAIAEFVPCEVVLTGAGLAYRPPGTTTGGTPPILTDGAQWPADMSKEPPEFQEAFAPRVPEPIVVADAIAVALDQPETTSDIEPHDTSEAAYEQADYDAAERLAREAIDRGEDTETVWIVLVRSLANRGDLDAAGEACSRALDRHRMSIELSHLHGILLAEAGRYADAAVAAKQALYLNPRYAVAHLALADALSRVGDIENARRSFRNAETLLAGFAADFSVPGADGAEAAQLLRIARFRLETLGMKPEPARR